MHRDGEVFMIIAAAAAAACRDAALKPDSN